jgi:hypothetical protein
MHNEPSVSVSRDRRFGTRAKIGHDRPKQAVTPYRNDRSRLTEMGGHDGPKYAVERLPIEFANIEDACDPQGVLPAPTGRLSPP